jgi:hypothetical protein
MGQRGGLPPAVEHGPVVVDAYKGPCRKRVVFTFLPLPVMQDSRPALKFEYFLPDADAYSWSECPPPQYFLY